MAESKRMVFIKSGGLTRMIEGRFRNEAEMEKLVGDNLGKIFPCLKEINRQFSIKNYRFDMLAYDSKKKCFVVIEYKNEKNEGLSDQVWGYKSIIGKSKDKFTDAYGRSIEKKLTTDFDWDKTYVITISSSYTEKQLTAADEILDNNNSILKMYQINQFDNYVVTLDRVRGSPVCEEKHLNPIIKPLRLDPGYDIDSDDLLRKFNSMIAGIDNITIVELKHYTAYKISDGRKICTVRKQKHRLKLYYNVKRSDKVLTNDEFVIKHDEAKKFGGKDYLSFISKYDHIKRAEIHLKKIYNFKIHGESKTH